MCPTLLYRSAALYFRVRTLNGYLCAGDGYCRSEAIVAVYLQKKESARRIYATLIHSKTNSDGYKDQGILLDCYSVILLEEIFKFLTINDAAVTNYA